MGDRYFASKALINLSDIAESLGEWRRAAGYVEESIRVSQHHKRQRARHFWCRGDGGTTPPLLRSGAPRTAARLLGANTYRTNTAQPLDNHEREQLDAIIEQTRTASGQARFAVAWAEGEALTLDQAVEESLTSIGDTRAAALTTLG